MPTQLPAWISHLLAALLDDDSAWRCLWGDSLLRSLVLTPWNEWH